MLKLEKQTFEQKNQEQIIKLQKKRVLLNKEKEKLELIKSHYVMLNFVKNHGKVISFAAGTITLFASYMMMRNLTNSIILTTSSILAIQGIKLCLKSSSERRIKEIDERIKECREEFDIRYQVEVYLLSGVVLATIGFYQNCLNENWVQGDSDFKQIIEDMIKQLEKDEELRATNLEAYENLLYERDKKLEMITEQYPDKVYLLKNKNFVPKLDKFSY